MKAQKKMTRATEIEMDTPVDYAANMFKDGKNRTATDKRARSAPGYDAAAHTMDADISDDVVDTSTHQLSDRTAKSRDGTEASGIYDEEGGPLGGTEEELDSLEAGGTPVDKNPYMKT